MAGGLSPYTPDQGANRSPIQDMREPQIITLQPCRPRRVKLICLNTWGGRAGREKLLAFLDAHRDADVVCLQEVWSARYQGLDGASAGGRPLDQDAIMVNGRQEIAELLDGHAVFFHPHHLDDYGLMTLVATRLEVVESGDVFVHRERGFIPEGDIGHHARNVQFVTVATPAGPGQRDEFPRPLERAGEGRQRRPSRPVAPHPRFPREPQRAVRALRRFQSRAADPKPQDARGGGLEKPRRRIRRDLDPHQPLYRGRSGSPTTYSSAPAWTCAPSACCPTKSRTTPRSCSNSP